MRESRRKAWLENAHEGKRQFREIVNNRKNARKKEIGVEIGKACSATLLENLTIKKLR